MVHVKIIEQNVKIPDTSCLPPPPPLKMKQKDCKHYEPFIAENSESIALNLCTFFGFSGHFAKYCVYASFLFLFY